jgi:FtsH-binding integral membrane protein
VANERDHSSSVYVTTKATLYGLTVVAVAWLTWEYRVPLFGSQANLLWFEGVGVVCISVFFCLRAFQNPSFTIAQRLSVLILVGVGGLVSAISPVVMLQPGANDRWVWVVFASAGAWLLGLAILVITGLRIASGRRGSEDRAA